MQSRHRLVLIAGGLAVVIAAALVTTVVTSQRRQAVSTVTETGVLPAVKRLGAKAVELSGGMESRWRREARLTALAQEDAQQVDAAAVRSKVRQLAQTWRVVDEDAALSPQQREMLLEAVAARIAAAALPTPEAYEALAGDAAAERMARRVAQARGVEWSVFYFFDERVKDDQLLDAFRRLWRKTAGELGHRIVSVGEGEHGGVVLVGTISSTDDIDMLSRAPEEVLDYWMGPRGGAAVSQACLRALTPRESLKDVIRRDGEALAANVVFIATLANGNTGAMVQQWFWNPAIKQWTLHDAAVRTARPFRVFQ